MTLEREATTDSRVELQLRIAEFDTASAAS